MTKSRFDQFDEPGRQLHREDAPETAERADEPPTGNGTRTHENGETSFAEVRERAHPGRKESRSRRYAHSWGEYILPQASQNMETEGARQECASSWWAGWFLASRSGCGARLPGIRENDREGRKMGQIDGHRGERG